MSDENGVPWYEDDTLWVIMEPVMFAEARIAQTPAEVDSIKSLCKIQSDEILLDLCCGVGRHSMEFARRGHKVVGVDRTRRYLERARKIASEEQLDIEFVLDDMRTFYRNKSFDIVLSVFTIFGYFDDHEEQMLILRNIYTSLRAGGRLFIESTGKEILARIFLRQNWSEWPRGFMMEEREPIENWSKMHNKWVFVEKDGTVHRWDFTHWIYSGAEIKEMLEKVGFSDVKVYGGLDGRPYDNEAERLVVIATK
ncbi:MAG: class I SAM-dependent methyltransferase [Candidatus Thorarchaeota archaeon]|jgi:SAM-dependent methyltransferase